MTNATTNATTAHPPDLRAALRLAATFALVKLLLQFALTLYTTHIGYSYFRDEFYFVACGRHLAAGFVDHGPAIALVARLGEILFGDSVFALRVFPAIAGAFAVALTGLLTWALGGERSAQALAMLALLLCPVYLATAGTLSIPAFEPMFWIAATLCIVLLQHGGPPQVLWPCFGTLAGLGLLTKPSLLFFLAALLASLLLTPQRRLLRSPWLLAATALALAIIAPFLLWEARNDWATWQFLRNGQIRHKTLVLAPVAFLWAQISQLNPVTAFLWIPGVFACFVSRALKPYRWIGLCYAIFLGLMFVHHAKDYYLAPVYPVLFAAGGVAYQSRFVLDDPSRQRLFAFPVLESALVVSGLLILPMSSPVLRPYTWARYTHALHLVANRSESEDTGLLPQFYADRFGWTQLASVVRNYTRALPPAERQRLCIIASNYGEAASLEFLATRIDPHLPPVISGHNNYWLWGMRGCDGHTLIAVVHDSPRDLSHRWKSVQILGTLNDPLAMSFEHKNVYLLREPAVDQPVNWREEKDFF